MLEQYKESSITIKQYFDLDMLRDLFLSFGYIGIMMLVIAFISIVFFMPGEF